MLFELLDYGCDVDLFVRIWRRFCVFVGRLWSIFSANGYKGTDLAGYCFEEAREMRDSASSVDVDR